MLGEIESFVRQMQMLRLEVMIIPDYSIESFGRSLQQHYSIEWKIVRSYRSFLPHYHLPELQCIYNWPRYKKNTNIQALIVTIKSSLLDITFVFVRVKHFKDTYVHKKGAFTNEKLKKWMNK